MFHFDPDTILMPETCGTLQALRDCACVQVLMPSYINITQKYLNTNNITCIPNIVPQYAEGNEAPRENVIINIARLDSRQKRQALLIEAFNLLKDKYPNWRIEFWGETEVDKKYYDECNTLIKKYDLGKQVHFMGVTGDVAKQYHRSKIFAFPSLFEGFPLALTEAMSAGLPAVGFRYCPAVNEIIVDGENGFLCDDVKGMAQALDKLMGDEQLRQKLGRRAKADMQAYAPEKIWDMWEELIQKTVGQGI